LLYSSKLLVVVNKTVTPIEAEYRAACPGAMPSTILRRKKITSSKSSRHAPVHQIEDREPVRIDDDGLAVERALPHRQPLDRGSKLQRYSAAIKN
jgi:hypothetical protein